jgi:hypothetical protein
MNLLDAVRVLPSLDERLTIYAARPWNEGSSVKLVYDCGSEREEAVSTEYSYFLEVPIANQLLEDWSATLKHEPSLVEKCARLISYAINDA